MSKLSVSTQGLNQNATCANGEYDTVERGAMTREQLVAFLEKVSKVSDPNYDSGEDICPPSVYIGEGDESVGLYLSEGELCEIETTTPVTPFEAVMLATGEKSIDTIEAQNESSPTATPKKAEPPAAQMVHYPPSIGRKFLAVFVALIPGCVGLSGTMGVAKSDSEYKEIFIIGIIFITLSFCRLIYTLVRGQGKSVLQKASAPATKPAKETRSAKDNSAQANGMMYAHMMNNDVDDFDAGE